ncbi:DUF1772 domain-containing protein [Fibrisoma montanum]|uniref:DUF1772 domain-containing protein n=1 Tax=Fibrisoma montanum TaxID=2305895 RepID=A0A418M0R4_9BACT|nr:anthrone oxygenase family protein [Fibrisoma montanum]RIV19089.1 DUF1772 domain-containing protein [Fibrisoma montanum]
MTTTADLLLLLFIINLGTAFGAGLYETRIILPQWFSKSAGTGYRVNTDAMRTVDSGRKFWAFVTTGPLTLITLANLVAAWQATSPRQDWWLAAALVALAERVSTFAFFIPMAIRLEKSDNRPLTTVSRSVRAWITLNYVRSVLTLVAWLCALWAFSQ